MCDNILWSFPYLLSTTLCCYIYSQTTWDKLQVNIMSLYKHSISVHYVSRITWSLSFGLLVRGYIIQLYSNARRWMNDMKISSNDLVYLIVKSQNWDLNYNSVHFPALLLINAVALWKITLVNFSVTTVNCVVGFGGFCDGLCLADIVDLGLATLSMS